MTQLAAHRRALVARRRCPACAEILAARSLFRDAPCGRCNAQISTFALSADDAMRPLSRKIWTRVAGVALLVAVGYLFLGWVPMLGTILLIAAAAWIKLGLIYPVSDGFSPARRVVSRWTAKLGLAVVIVGSVLLIEAMTLLGPLGPPAKALLAAAQTVVSAGTVGLYLRWQLRREAAGKALLWMEWGMVLGITAGLLLTTAVVVGGLAALAHALQGLLDNLTVWLGA